MCPLKSIHLSITEARAARAGRGVFDGGVAQGSEHPLDKRGVAGSIPASTTKGTCAGDEAPAASLSCGGSTMVVHRSAKSKATGSSPVPRSTSRGRVPTVIAVGEGLVRGSSTMVVRRPSKSVIAGSSPVSRSVSVCTVSPEWEGSGSQPRRLQRQRRFDPVTVLHPLNMTAVPSARRLVCSRGCSSVVEHRAVNPTVGGSIPSVLALFRSEIVMTPLARENWRTSSDRSPYKGRSGDGTGLQNQSGEFDSPAPCHRQQQQ